MSTFDVLDTSGFVPRWRCGAWPPSLAWLHIVSDLLIWIAYLTIPLILMYFIRHRRDTPFPRIFWLFGAFIVACGSTHLLEAIIFYLPLYRLSGMLKLATAVVSWATVIALIPVLPKALALRAPHELEVEVNARTSELAETNAVLQLEIESRKRTEETVLETSRQREQAMNDLQTRSEELRTTTQQLWQSSKLASVGELAASIAHELNNPLTTVRLRIESLLNRTSLDDVSCRHLRIVEQEAQRMADLVANLLSFSRRGEEKISTVDVRNELIKAVELIQHSFHKRQITVEWKLAGNTPSIYVDRQKLFQVFLNLLSNASDAMPLGGSLTLYCAPATMDAGQPAVQIEFMDTGIGISAEHLPQVFDPFFTTKADGQGTGLGLAICRRAVEEHQGTIQIRSVPGKGTTVRIVVPVSNGANVDRLIWNGTAD